jgi:hypothetical protein
MTDTVYLSGQSYFVMREFGEHTVHLNYETLTWETERCPFPTQELAHSVLRARLTMERRWRELNNVAQAMVLCSIKPTIEMRQCFEFMELYKAAFEGFFQVKYTE